MRASSAPAVGGSRVGRAPGVCEVCPVAACALGGRWHGVGAEAEAVRPGRGRAAKEEEKKGRATIRGRGEKSDRQIDPRIKWSFHMSISHR